MPFLDDQLPKALLDAVNAGVNVDGGSAVDGGGGGNATSSGAQGNDIFESVASHFVCHVGIEPHELLLTELICSTDAASYWTMDSSYTAGPFSASYPLYSTQASMVVSSCKAMLLPKVQDPLFGPVQFDITHWVRMGGHDSQWRRKD